MRLRITLLLLVTVMIALGYPSTVAAQQLPQGCSVVMQLNEDVVCADCPPGSQPEEWAMIFTNPITATCTRIDTYHAPCPEDCEWTLVSSELSGSCNGSEPSLPGPEVCPECPQTENIKKAWYDTIGGGCYMSYGYIHCPYNGNCHPHWEFVVPILCPWEIWSLKGPDAPDGVNREPAALSFVRSSRNPTSEPVVFRMGVPEASRGAHEELVLFDLLGRRVRTLFSGVATSGSREQTWDLRTDAGLRAQPGMYYARYRLGNEVRKQTVVIVK